jgi:hypothetical protein
LLSSFSSIPHQHILDTQPPPPGESGTNTGSFAGATSNTEVLGTQQERRHKLVHLDAANVATKHMTQDPHLKIVRKTGSSKNKDRHAVGCEYIIIEANGGQLTVYRTAGVCRELCNEFIAARNGKPPWSTKTFVRKVRAIEHHDEVSSGMFADDFPNKRPREWTKQALITLVQATEAYMVEVTAEFHC